MSHETSPVRDNLSKNEPFKSNGASREHSISSVKSAGSDSPT